MAIAAAELTSAQQMTVLCESFPTLRGAQGTAPWEPLRFAAWATKYCDGEAQRQAAAFVLSVWNNGTPSDGGWWNQGALEVGRFDPVMARHVWDSWHNGAFLTWFERPFLP